MQSTQRPKKANSREPSPDRPIAQPPRQRAACESCHSSKVRCTGGNPCARCSASRSECIYKLVSRIGKPKGSRNKSTLRRLQLEAEQASRQEAERSGLGSSQGEGSYSRNAILGFYQHATVGQDASPMTQSWDCMMHSRNWPGDSEVPGGSFHMVSDPVSSPEWAYGSELGTVECQPSIMSTAPLEDTFLEGGDLTLYDDSTLRINTSGALQSRLPSLTSDSSYTSSPWSGSAAAPANPSEDNASYPSQDLFTIPPTQAFPAHTSCHCAENLAGHLCSFRHPEALNSTTHSADGFLRNTDQLYFAITCFLDCQTCEKNSMALSLMITILATFGQLFAALSGSADQGSPLSSSSNVMASRNLSRQLSFGSYQSASDGESTVRAMLIGQTAQKWREACFRSNRLLEQLQANTQSPNYSVEGSEYGLEMATGGEGTPLWGSADLDSFARVASRVDSELAVYS